jgi:hypothetical protein
LYCLTLLFERNLSALIKPSIIASDVYSEPIKYKSSKGSAIPLGLVIIIIIPIVGKSIALESTLSSYLKERS